MTARDDNGTTRDDQPRRPAWQFYVTLFVTLAAVAAFAMFIYGFCTMEAR